MQTHSVKSIYRSKVRAITSRLPHGVTSFETALKQSANSSSASVQTAKNNTSTATKGENKLIPVIFNPDALKNFKPMTSTRASAVAAPSLQQIAEDDGNAALRHSVIEYAMQFLGTPYVWGGEDLQNGTDCSGFTQSVFKQFGIDLPRTAYYQSSEGQEVTLESMKPGDLLFFKTADYAPVTHVGIYLGDDQFVHASSSKDSVCVADLSSRWKRKIVTIKRFI